MMLYLVSIYNWLGDTAPGVLLSLIVGDIITGLLKAAGTGQVSSDISRVGMARKAGILMAVAIAHILEKYSGQPLVLGTASFFVISEGISVIENLSALGVRMPALSRYFKLLAEQLGAHPSPSAPPVEPTEKDGPQ